MHPVDEPFLTGRTGMGQLCPEVSGTSGALTLAFKELFLQHIAITFEVKMHFPESVSIITLTGDSPE
jgi:hypothetical protein